MPDPTLIGMRVTCRFGSYQSMFGAFKPELDLPKTPVTFTYLILSQPRTGSTMITSALQASEQAGVPVEYFNNQHLRKLPRPLTLASVHAYYTDVVSRRTSGNGVFGMKLHHDQFKPLFVKDNTVTEAGAKFLRSFDRIIVTSRRDKLAQAISKLAAYRSGKWNTSDRSLEGRQNYDFKKADVPIILTYLQDAVSGEMFWDDICARLDLHPLRISYEDLNQSPETELAKVFAHLQLEVAPIAPQTVKLSRDNNREAKLRFLREIGFEMEA
jgi:LPS sulfotransferase NodH